MAVKGRISKRMAAKGLDFEVKGCEGTGFRSEWLRRDWISKRMAVKGLDFEANGCDGTGFRSEWRQRD